MLFTKDFPEKLRSSILTSEVVGKKVKLKQRGNEFHGLCPFHNEKTPSFTVNDQKGFYHCFGCQAHGDIISFTIEDEGLDFKDAVVKLADDFSIPVPQVSFKEINQNNGFERSYLILEKCCQFFEKNLYGDQGLSAREYLKKRTLNSAISKKFRLGFALNSYDALIKFLKSENFTDLEISKTGIVGTNDRKQTYDKLRNRIIFPITDKKDRVIAFGGRTIGNDMPKYLNSAETDLFKKSQTLYNIFLARKPIFQKSYAIVVEGYMDVIALSANGIENVVAGLGTALGIDHLTELFYITDKIVICLDGDTAGIRAAKRVSELALPLITAKKNLAFNILPNQMDPDDFIQEFGIKETEKTFENPTPLSESLFEFALMDLGINKNEKVSAENKAKLENNLDIKVETILDHSSKKYFSFFFKDLLYSLGRNKKGQETNFSGLTKNIYAKPSSNISDIMAKNIIAFITKYPELSEFRDDNFDVAELLFNNESLTRLKEVIIEDIANDKENILSSLENSEFSNDIKDIKNITEKLNLDDANLVLIKFRILLLKDLLLKVDEQYKYSLSKIDDIETHQSALIDQKIKEIFDYKNSLEQQILSLEKEII